MIREMVIRMLANHYHETLAQARQNFAEMSDETMIAAFAMLTI